MKISKSAVIFLLLLFTVCVLPPIFVLSAIAYRFLSAVPFIPYFLSYWRGLIIILFLSSDITFWTISGKSLIPWGNPISQIVYVCILFLYLLMNIVRFMIYSKNNVGSTQSSMPTPISMPSSSSSIIAKK